MKKVLLALAAVAVMAAPAMAATGSPTVLDPTTEGGGVNTKQYHSYDGLICTDCHTLHNSEDGATVVTVNADGTVAANGTSANRELLFRGDWTDMCLSCHKEGQNQSSTAALPDVFDGGWTAPIVMTTDGYYKADGTINGKTFAMPGGDFYYSNQNAKLGHNPAYTKGSTGGTGSTGTSLFMASDTILFDKAPGGTTAAVTNGQAVYDGEWSCHSCHGMHSRFSATYSAWRQIKRKVNKIVIAGCDDTATAGLVETSDCSSTVADTAAGFEAILSNSRGNVSGTTLSATRGDGDPVDGASLWALESDTNKNVYRGGFSSFCAACHGNFHDNSTTKANSAADQGDIREGNAWVRHPTNLILTGGTETGSSSVIKAKYGVTVNSDTAKGGYNVAVINANSTVVNPPGYDWKYPLVVEQASGDANKVLSTTASAGDKATLTGNERIMCLTCHVAHASPYENMTRWDTNAHAFLAQGEIDHTGAAVAGDNPAYGCGKCHQKGGRKAFK